MIIDSINSPHSVEAEEAVLGSILIDPSQYHVVADILGGDDFWLVRHSIIWCAFAAIVARNEPLDIITVIEEIDNQKQLEMIGGRAYLYKLVNNLGHALHAQIYAELVSRTALRRRMLQAADEIKALALDETMNTTNVVTMAERKLFEVTNGNRERSPMEKQSQNADGYREMLANRKGGKVKQGVASGYPLLDKITGGWERGGLVIVGGRPSMGKSAFMLNSAFHVSAVGGTVLYVTLEMTEIEQRDRMLALDSRIPLKKIKNGDFTDKQAAYLDAVVESWQDMEWWFRDTGTYTPAQLRSDIQRVKFQSGRIDLVVVDYLQLMSGGDLVNQYTNRTQEIGMITRAAKQMAKDYDVPIMMGAQLSRKVEERKNKLPLLSDLRESGDIENDASQVILLYRDEYYFPKTTMSQRILDVFVAKNRNGETGEMEMVFAPELACVSEGEYAKGPLDPDQEAIIRSRAAWKKIRYGER